MINKIKVPLYRSVSFNPNHALHLSAQEDVVDHIEVWNGMNTMDFYDQLPKDLRDALKHSGGSLKPIFEAVHRGYTVEEIVEALNEINAHLL